MLTASASFSQAQMSKWTHGMRTILSCSLKNHDSNSKLQLTSTVWRILRIKGRGTALPCKSVIPEVGPSEKQQQNWEHSKNAYSWITPEICRIRNCGDGSQKFSHEKAPSVILLLAESENYFCEHRHAVWSLARCACDTWNFLEPQCLCKLNGDGRICFLLLS